MYHKATDNDFGHENFAETKFSIIVNEHYNVMTKEQIQDLISVAIVKESNVIFMDASWLCSLLVYFFSTSIKVIISFYAILRDFSAIFCSFFSDMLYTLYAWWRDGMDVFFYDDCDLKTGKYCSSSMDIDFDDKPFKNLKIVIL